jgi:hypothetical protein
MAPTVIRRRRLPTENGTEILETRIEGEDTRAEPYKARLVFDNYGLRQPAYDRQQQIHARTRGLVDGFHDTLPGHGQPAYDREQRFRELDKYFKK